MKIKKPKVIPAGVTPVQKGTEPGDRYNSIRPRSSSSWTIPVSVIISIIFVIYGVIHYVMNSEPYKISESFIRQNQTIKTELGGVDKCDPWYPIEMYPFGREDFARITFDVVGTNKVSTEVSVSLQKKGDQWRIVAASYKDRQGFIKPLVQEGRIAAEKPKQSRGPVKKEKN
ncbi:MAG: cytochrome c oxidase assembly factor Coa1 family protein [Deltaproteobacteria bacterium]|nr:cytochrome c oxidase assembly factor Coa1 family protein [Deltaproteobacteria bacterium]